jgi:hypothetical protein
MVENISIGPICCITCRGLKYFHCAQDVKDLKSLVYRSKKHKDNVYNSTTPVGLLITHFFFTDISLYTNSRHCRPYNQM